MDILFFLKERTRFIRYFYETAAAPFREIVRKIEVGEAPFVPEYGEDEEPPFLIEWQEADTGTHIVGEACISMLSEALRLYFHTWESELQIQLKEDERKRLFKNGFIQGYQCYFRDNLKITWDECPVDFDLLEQITLARNAAQHPEDILTMKASHNMRARKRFPSPFFVSDQERHMVSVSNPLAKWFAPSIHVSVDKLMAAIYQVELLADWLEDRLIAVREQR
ncbi:MAG TPA: hypothetical protein VK558_17825 [Patescibacteria group bacterium]|nr:hypothetical protein [Patescibacteria group bacterium]